MPLAKQTNLDFPSDKTLMLGELQQIAPEIYGLRLPLPYQLNHVNVWLLGDADGFTLVDCGLNTPESQAIWREILTSPLLQQRPIKRMIITHYHPDHVGAAGWLQTVLPQPAQVWFEPYEWQIARTLTLDMNDSQGPLLAAHYQRCGLDAEIVRSLTSNTGNYRRSVAIPPTPIKALRNGLRLQLGGREWLCFSGAGHTPAMIGLYCAADKLLIAADHILPNISPNVSVWAYQPNDNPLADYYKTLRRLKIYNPDTFVLPSHGQPFYGLYERSDWLLAHHQERLEQLSSLHSDYTVKQAMDCLFPTVTGPHQIIFALGETLAHLNYLVENGTLKRAEINGLLRYS